ncbi:hypothetical protein B0H13DRAFT_1860962 [Mycena leptocephala]|nr:hypothetical protein B0H13DRAFT_1860962 [Mycena leptocephala]
MKHSPQTALQCRTSDEQTSSAHDGCGRATEHVGRLWGFRMGSNSEVGHLNIGAGHVISDRGVHSHITHLYALDGGKEQCVPTPTCTFSTTGATPPRAPQRPCDDFTSFMEQEQLGALVMVVGWYYAMDRDKRG